MELTGLYAGVVEENNDPEKLGRLKVRVPVVYADASSIGIDQLPWSLPRGMPFGASGGISFLPDKGDQVWVMFLDGEPEKPVWEWAMATRSTANATKLHQYEKGKPKRVAFLRTGHLLEINDDGIILTTKNGQVLVLDDSGESIVLRNSKWQHDITIDESGTTLKTASGQAIIMDDTFKTIIVNSDNVEFQVGDELNQTASSMEIKAIIGPLTVSSGTSLNISVGSPDLNSATLDIDETGVVLDAKDRVSVSSAAEIDLAADTAIILRVGQRSLLISPEGFTFA